MLNIIGVFSPHCESPKCTLNETIRVCIEEKVGSSSVLNHCVKDALESLYGRQLIDDVALDVGAPALQVVHIYVRRGGIFKFDNLL